MTTTTQRKSRRRKPARIVVPSKSYKSRTSNRESDERRIERRVALDRQTQRQATLSMAGGLGAIGFAIAGVAIGSTVLLAVGAIASLLAGVGGTVAVHATERKAARKELMESEEKAAG